MNKIASPPLNLPTFSPKRSPLPALSTQNSLGNKKQIENTNLTDADLVTENDHYPQQSHKPFDREFIDHDPRIRDLKAGYLM